MRFMNHWDIDEACQRWANHPVLGPASQTMRNLRDVADANSDGWAYWPKPARSAAKLMELIEGNGTNEYRYGEREDATYVEWEAISRDRTKFRSWMAENGFEAVS